MGATCLPSDIAQGAPRCAGPHRGAADVAERRQRYGDPGAGPGERGSRRCREGARRKRRADGAGRRCCTAAAGQDGHRAGPRVCPPASRPIVVSSLMCSAAPKETRPHMQQTAWQFAPYEPIAETRARAALQAACQGSAVECSQPVQERLCTTCSCNVGFAPAVRRGSGAQRWARRTSKCTSRKLQTTTRCRLSTPLKTRRSTSCCCATRYALAVTAFNQ